MGKKFLTLALALFVLCAQAFAQSTVSGRVTDESGEPLVEANVIIKGTLTGTTTNLDGYWTLPNVKSGTVLEFSSIGFATQSVTVGSKKTINVVLKSDALFLNDAIVVGYGSTKRKDLTGS
ncbi:MAG: carboxypeptidase-like regulatory domain-containing protein, partial [Bacteroidales bacterium]|nr:carboxypeptidase-like regulatory domain-containing protein [Bacteroidales bacterium]